MAISFNGVLIIAAVAVAVPVVLGLLAAAEVLGRAGRESLVMRRSRQPSLPG